MVSNIPSALDNLAANGVIDFDANAYIKGEKPRYVGSPKNALFLNRNAQGMPKQNQPIASIKDEFVKKTITPKWKKILAGTLFTGLTLLAAIKMKKVRKLILKPFTFAKNKIKPN